MRTLALAALPVLIAASCAVGCDHAAGQSPAPPVSAGPATSGFDTVHVARPTGEESTDRASILAALEQVRPAGTVQFAPGTYLVGRDIDVTVPGITLQGHPDGTTLRGCDPGDIPEAGGWCGGLLLIAAQQTVRGFTFEYSGEWLYVGCCVPSDPAQRIGPDVSQGLGHPGGHLIEGNTFRNSGTSIRVGGESAEPIVVRQNRFVNTFHAIGIVGGEVHFLANDISVPEPDAVPRRGYAGYAISISPGISMLWDWPPQRPQEHTSQDHTSCARNIVEANRIEGHIEGVALRTVPGSSCVNNVIRDNTIIVQRTRAMSPPPGFRMTDESDSTLIGTPLILQNLSDEGAIEDNLIEGNHIIGAEGIGIEVRNASRNRIVSNTITGVVRRQPFPGNLDSDLVQTWREANGSGIWVSPGSPENEIIGNTFEEIASQAVVVEGDRNHVELRSASDAVHDAGSGNRVSTPSGDWTDPSPHTVRLVAVAPDVHLEVLDWGGTGEPLVLLAGMMATAHTWDDFATRFTDRFRVVAITRRGFGGSSQPADGYDLDTLADDIRAVLDSLNVNRAALVGHSYGVDEVVRLARRWPDRVSHMVSLDGMMFPDIDQYLAAMSAVPGGASASDEDRASLAAFGHYLTRMYGVRLPDAEIRARWPVLPDGRVGEERTSGEIPRAILLATDLTPLDDLDVPLLAMRHLPGSAAALIPWYGELSPEDRAHADRAFPALHQLMMDGWTMFEALRSVRFIDFPDANHHLYISHAREVEEAMREFLLDEPAPSDPDSIDLLVLQHMDAREIPGVSLVVMRGGQLVKQAAFGRASLELDVAATSSTTFPYASMAKVFTGTAILRLVEQGRLSLDDRITDLLPGLPEAWAPVTVRRLLDHTSGLPDVVDAPAFPAYRNPFPASVADRDEVLAQLMDLPVKAAPGEGYAYNQTGYALLAMLLEKLDGRTIDEYVKGEFAEPLGLESLVYGDARRVLPERATWYTRMDYSSDVPQPTELGPLWMEYPSWLHAGAGLNGTALDLARFVDAVASGTLLDPALRGEMWAATRLADGHILRFGDGTTGVGLGWRVDDDSLHPSVGMGGGASGAFRHYVNDILTVVVLTNLQGAAPEALLAEVAEHYLPRSVGTASGEIDEAAPQSAPAASVAACEGRFVDAGGLRLHYLDFGGEGLPLVLVHSEARDACTYQDFGPRFTATNRVLAVTRPGYGQSEGRSHDVPSQAESLIDFLDALDLDRAVFAGNASATAELTYLAEHHPGRVAGVVYFSGLALPWLEEHESDRNRAFEMFARAAPGEATAGARTQARSAYRPGLSSAHPTAITMPALAFVARSGSMGSEDGVGALVQVGSPLMSEVRSRMPPSPVRDHLDRLASDEAFRSQQIDGIQDPEARAYFRRLASDPALQAEIYRYHQQVILPALRAGHEQFRRAFGDNLRLVRLDVDVVVGYEYRDAPDLVEPHLRGFLEKVARLHDTAQVAPPTGTREADPDETDSATYGCGLFQLTGGHASVRGLAFEHAWSDLILGCCEATLESRPTHGGNLIEHNTFRSSMNGVRGILWAQDPAVI